MSENARKLKKRSKPFTVKFASGEEVELYIRLPKQREIHDMEKHYRIAMTDLLEDGVASNHKLARILEKNGEWTAEDANDETNYAKLIARNSEALRTTKDENDDEENYRIANSILGMRAKYLELVGRRMSLFENSAENQAQISKMHAFVALCCCNEEDDEPYFRDADHYAEIMHCDPEAISELLAHATAFDYGTEVGVDPTEEWAEIEFIRQDAESRIDGDEGDTEDPDDSGDDGGTIYVGDPDSDGEPPAEAHETQDVEEGEDSSPEVQNPE